MIGNGKATRPRPNPYERPAASAARSTITNTSRTATNTNRITTNSGINGTANRGSLSLRTRSSSPLRSITQTVKKVDPKQEIASLKEELNIERRQSTALFTELETKNEELSKIKTEFGILKMKYERSEQNLQSCKELIEEQNENLRKTKEEMMHFDMEKRKLLNDLVDSKGQIRVAVRTRPLLSHEEQSSDHLGYPSPNTITIEGPGIKAQTFEYQRVFGPNFSQKRIFDDVEELILSALHGYNVSIIAFGQTGSGKTFTMRGGNDEVAEGIIPRATKCIFKNRDKLIDLGWEFKLTASYVEVYNDEIFDLLANKSKVVLKKVGCLDYAENLVRKTIDSLSTIDQLLLTADKNRSVSATKCNEHSSRSHALFELKVEATNPSLKSQVSSVLHLVDLAGSERVKESGAEGSVFKEMTHINQSLSALQMCIRAQLLKQNHVPYRNSKLTSLLSSSLGAGSSKTFVMVALNPSLSQIAETKRSLDFAKEMSNTKIGVAFRQDK